MDLIDLFLQHSRRFGLVLDTNVYILYVTGIVSPESVGTDRTKKYTLTHFEILREIVSGAKTKTPIITPHIVPEITHLLGVDRNRRSSSESIYKDALLNSFKISREEYMATAELIRDGESFVDRFGIADASVARIVQEYALLSDDNELVSCLQSQKKPAITLDTLYNQEMKYKLGKRPKK